tara:strand:- start:2793 stop:3047 length:255 start_codon:yes stop_codon:yes gene_type:complete
MSELYIQTSDNVQTGESGYVVRGELVPDQVLTHETQEHVIIVTCRTRADIDPIVAVYDPDSASSPNAGDSRSIARPIVAHLAGE